MLMQIDIGRVSTFLITRLQAVNVHACIKVHPTYHGHFQSLLKTIQLHWLGERVDSDNENIYG